MRKCSICPGERHLEPDGEMPVDRGIITGDRTQAGVAGYCLNECIQSLSTNTLPRSLYHALADIPLWDHGQCHPQLGKGKAAWAKLRDTGLILR